MWAELMPDVKKGGYGKAKTKDKAICITAGLVL